MYLAGVHSDEACIGSKARCKVAEGGYEVTAATAEVLEQRHHLGRFAMHEHSTTTTCTPARMLTSRMQAMPAMSV